MDIYGLAVKNKSIVLPSPSASGAVKKQQDSLRV